VDSNLVKLPAIVDFIVRVLVWLRKTSGYHLEKINTPVILLSAFLFFYGMSTSPSHAQNWFPTSAPVQNWTALAMSSEGNKILAVSSQGPVFTSSNGGASWTQTSAPSGNWVCAASSSDGANLVAARATWAA
jgi:hypothetical protein